MEEMKVRVLLFVLILTTSWQCTNEKVFNQISAEALISKMKQYPEIKYLNVNFEDRVIINQREYSTSEQYIRTRQEAGYQIRKIQCVYSDFGLTVEVLQDLKRSFNKLGVQSYAQDNGSFLFIMDSFKGDIVVGYLKSDMKFDQIST